MVGCPYRFSNREQNSWFGYGNLFRSWIIEAGPDDHTTMFTVTKSCVTLHCISAKTFNFWLICPLSSIPKILANLCVLFGQRWFQSSMMSFLPIVFLKVESWSLAQGSEACSSLDVHLDSFMTSWMSHQIALGGILVGRALIGRFECLSKLSPVVDNDPSVIHWSFRVGTVDYFVLRLFLSFAVSIYASIRLNRSVRSHVCLVKLSIIIKKTVWFSKWWAISWIIFFRDLELWFSKVSLCI